MKNKNVLNLMEKIAMGTENALDSIVFAIKIGWGNSVIPKFVKEIVMTEEYVIMEYVIVILAGQDKIVIYPLAKKIAMVTAFAWISTYVNATKDIGFFL